jgi:hypothetical protein
MALLEEQGRAISDPAAGSVPDEAVAAYAGW